MGFINKDIALSSLAKEVGGLIYSNVIVLGLLSGILDINLNLIKDYITNHFSAKGK